MTSRHRIATAGLIAALLLVVGGAWWLRTPTATGTWHLEHAPERLRLNMREGDDGSISGVGLFSPEEWKGGGLPVTVRGLRVGREVIFTLGVDTRPNTLFTFTGRVVRRGVMTGKLSGGSDSGEITLRTGAPPAPRRAAQEARPDSADAALDAAAEARLQRLREILREQGVEGER